MAHRSGAVSIPTWACDTFRSWRGIALPCVCVGACVCVVFLLFYLPYYLNLVQLDDRLFSEIYKSSIELKLEILFGCVEGLI